MLPKDPVILLSYLNTKLRDEFPDLASLCSALDIERENVEITLSNIGYRYDSEKNQFC